jgi:hypothetical protein
VETTIDNYDVVVVGGGPGGCGAAYRAATSGAKTLLIEREGCLGGGATTMLVNPFMPHLTGPGPKGEAQVEVNAGMFAEVIRRILARDAGKILNPGTKWTVLIFDDEVLKIVLDELLREAGVKVLYHAALFDAQTEGCRINSVRIAHNSGPLRVTGKVFIDGTGDGLLAHVAGCQWQQGNQEGLVMPMTLNFIVAGVDTSKLPSMAALKKRTEQGGNDQPALINTNVSCFHALPNGRVHFNAVRVTGSGLDPSDLSRAEEEGRRRALNFTAWLAGNIDGFQSCWLAKTGSHIGVRETRRVVGDYELNFGDLQAARKFADAIACCCYVVDIHGQKPNEMTEIEVPQGDWYEIPYRCLTPKGIDNILMASRSVSADVMVHASLRIMPVVMNIGEAAGFAATLSLPTGRVRDIKVPDLRRRIRDSGGMPGILSSQK